MNGNEKTELKLLEKCTLSDNRNTYDPFGGLFLRCWSLPQAFCLLSAGLCFWLWLLLSASLCFWLQLAPRAFIIIFITVICICFTIHFEMVVVLFAMMCPSRVGIVPFASLAIDELLPIFKRNIPT